MSLLFKILQAHHDIISDVMPVDQDAFRLKPDGISLPDLEAAISPILQANGWICTGHSRGVLIEPEYNNKVEVKKGHWLYHVSGYENRAGILDCGLEVRNGGNTSMQRKYNGRIFVSLTFSAALQFIDFQCRDHRNPITGQIVFAGKNRAKIDVWRVKMNEQQEFYRDVLFPGQAAWTDLPIPADQVSLYENWRYAEKAWNILRRMGIF